MPPEEMLEHTLSMNNAMLYYLSTFDKDSEARKIKEQQNCPYLEEEQDMNATTLFCGRDGQFCNMQCKH